MSKIYNLLCQKDNHEQKKWVYRLLAEILTSNSVGTQLFFLGCNQDNIGGSNFISKKKICLVLPEKEISNLRN